MSFYLKPLQLDFLLLTDSRLLPCYGDLLLNGFHPVQVRQQQPAAVFVGYNDPIFLYIQFLPGCRLFHLAQHIHCDRKPI